MRRILLSRYLYITMRGVCSLHLPIAFEFNASVFYHLCTYFFVAYCCRGILLILFYYNVRRMFVASRICACIMQFSFEFNVSFFYHLCMYFQSFPLFLLPIYHIPPCKSQYHSYYSFSRSTSRACICSLFLSLNDCMII